MASEMNGPVSMYKLKPYYDKTDVELPNVMYKLKSYYDQNAPHQKSSDTSSSDIALTELEKRQEAILTRLEELRSEVAYLATKSVTATSASSMSVSTGDGLVSAGLSGVLKDIVISASPDSPPLSVYVLYSLLAQQYQVATSCHTHSSAIGCVPSKLCTVFGEPGIITNRNSYHLALTIIWKQVNPSPSLMVSPKLQTPIHGEANIARYLARLLTPSYETGDIGMTTEIDSLLELAVTLDRGNSKEKAAVVRTLNGKLGKSTWLVGSDVTLADIVLWSALQRLNLASSAPGNVKKWIEVCNQHPAFQYALKLIS